MKLIKRLTYLFTALRDHDKTEALLRKRDFEATYWENSALRSQDGERWHIQNDQRELSRTLGIPVTISWTPTFSYPKASAVKTTCSFGGNAWQEPEYKTATIYSHDEPDLYVMGYRVFLLDGSPQKRAVAFRNTPSGKGE
jgi:hypothetical protein